MPDQQTEPIDIPEEVRILHLSDLHAGRGFESNRWSDLLDLLDETIRPQVVIVSGDMVNSPTRSDFKQATNRINELREKCGSLEWPLSAGSTSDHNSLQSVKGRVIEAVRKMIRLATPDAKGSALNKVCGGIQAAAVSAFGFADTQFRCSIMAYDERLNALRVVAADFEQNDARWALQLNYGDGIAGRAFKMNRGRVFVKQQAIEKGTPFYYVTTDREPVSDDGHEIPDEVVVSLPLFSREGAESLLGVLSLSSNRASSKLADINEDRLRENTRDLIESVGDSCLKVLDELN